MAYRATGESTTLTPEEMSAEARRILGMLDDVTGRMTVEEYRFVSGQAEAAEMAEAMGARYGVTVKQLWWLRDLKEKYL